MNINSNLDSVIASLTILLPRLTPTYRQDVEACIELLKQSRQDLEEKTAKLQALATQIRDGSRSIAD